MTKPSRPDSTIPGAVPRSVARVIPFAIALTALAFFVLRLLAPDNLLDQDQERPSAYVLDAVNNGNWLCQRDLSGDITSKPPLYTWLAAIPTALLGRISVFTLYWPGAFGACLVALLIWRVGRIHFGDRAALWGAFASMLTTAAVKQFGLARTDGVFTLAVTVTALLAFHCWNRGSGWTWFWLAGAAATLTKGPLGVILAGGGLLAVVWERRTNDRRLPRKGSHLLGILLFFSLTAGWLLLSYWEYGEPVIQKIIGKELVGNAVKHRKNSFPGALFWQPTLYYLGRAAPWSLLAYLGFWRLWKHPATEITERRFERFLFCWFFVGLTFFSLSLHQRADLLWPIMPAGALIAGRELARLTGHWSVRRLAVTLGSSVAIALIGFSYYYGWAAARTPVVQRTGALREMAREIERIGGTEFPLTHVDDPMTLQFYLDTLRPRISAERAAELLRGPEPAYVAIKNQHSLDPYRRPEDPAWPVLLPENSGTNAVQIVSNRPKLQTEDSFAFCFGTLFVRAQKAKLINAVEKELTFEFSDDQDAASVISLTNEASELRRIRVNLLRAGRTSVEERTLAPGEIWRISSVGPSKTP